MGASTPIVYVVTTTAFVRIPSDVLCKQLYDGLYTIITSIPTPNEFDVSFSELEDLKPDGLPASLVSFIKDTVTRIQKERFHTLPVDEVHFYT